MYEVVKRYERQLSNLSPGVHDKLLQMVKRLEVGKFNKIIRNN